MIIRIILATFLLLFSSCKTQEEIEREKLIDALNIGLKQVQELTAEQSMRLDEIEKRLMETTGRFEEVGHQTKAQTSTEFTALKNEISILKEKNKTYEIEIAEANKKLSQVKDNLKTQSAYSKQVLTTLKDISGKNKSLYEQAMENYGRNNFTMARDQFLILLEEKSTTSKQKERILHNRGVCEASMKKYEDALVAYSKLIQTYPKSIYIPSAMLNMAKTFISMNDNESATQTLEELVKRHPTHKRAILGKELLKKIKK